MIDTETPEFRKSQRTLEGAIFEMRCIGRTLIMLTEGAGDYAEVFSFLGSALLDQAEGAQQAFNSIIWPDTEVPGMPVEPARAAQ